MNPEDIKPIIFKKDGVRYTYTYTIESVEYDGEETVKWDECVWQPPHIKEELNK